MVEGLVSTVIPVFNRGEMLCEAVASVLAQTWRPIEILIVDDGSTDNTVAVAEQLAAKNPDIIRVLSQANAGPGAARQLGLEASNGEFVQFLDSDDLLMPGKFALQVQALRGDREAGISYGYCLVQKEFQAETLLPPKQEQKHRDIFPTILNRRLWATIAPLYRRTTCLAIGPWSRRRVLEDWDYDGRAGVLGIKLQFCDDVLATKTFHQGEHAGRAWHHDAGAMRDRIYAYAKFVEYARQAGVTRDSAEMRAFVRSLFWMARVAGRCGFPEEAQHLFNLAKTNAVRPGWDFRLFGLAANIFGWKWAGKVATMGRDGRSPK